MGRLPIVGYPKEPKEHIVKGFEGSKCFDNDDLKTLTDKDRMQYNYIQQIKKDYERYAKIDKMVNIVIIITTIFLISSIAYLGCYMYSVIQDRDSKIITLKMELNDMAKRIEQGNK